jgi:hypothetical protein
MMRQALLGWQISKNKDHGCTSFRQVLVVPAANVEFHTNVTSKALKGASVSEAWSALLRCPNSFISTTPANFMLPILDYQDTKALTKYLQLRYWSGS